MPLDQQLAEQLVRLGAVLGVHQMLPTLVRRGRDERHPLAHPSEHVRGPTDGVGVTARAGLPLYLFQERRLGERVPLAATLREPDEMPVLAGGPALGEPGVGRGARSGPAHRSGLTPSALLHRVVRRLGGFELLAAEPALRVGQGPDIE